MNYFTTKCKSYFLVREIFLKSSRILYLKNNTRWHEGFKLPLCTFHVVMQIQANFTTIAKSTFYDFYWLFLFLTSLALFLLLWLRLSFTISFRNERKRVYKIAWQLKRFRPHISRVNFLFILGVNTDCRRILQFSRLSARLKTYTSYTSNCIVFDLNYFCNSYQVCSFLQVGLQRFSKKCPALNICA